MTPSRQEKLFQKSYAGVLIKISEGDLASAEVLAQASSGRIENAFYLAQQSIEKALKAVLVQQQIAVPLIHDLGGLIALIPKQIEPPYGYELSELNQYAALRRYEEGSWEPTPAELAVVLEKAKEMLSWAKLQVK